MNHNVATRTRWILAAGVLAYGIDATMLMTRACLAVPDFHGHLYTRHVEHMIQVLILVGVVAPPFAAVSLGLLTDRCRWGGAAGAALAAVVIGAVLVGDTLGDDPLKVYAGSARSMASFFLSLLAGMMAAGALLGAIGSLVRNVVPRWLAANKRCYTTIDQEQAP